MKKEAIQLARDLDSKIKGDVHIDSWSKGQAAKDGSIYFIKPLLVIHPYDDEDIYNILSISRDKGIPITCRGFGTSTAGQSIGKGIVLDFTRYFNKAVSIDLDEKKAIVQPGIRCGRLNKLLKQHNYYFAPDPSSKDFCSIGGMVSNNSAGYRSLKFGSTLEHVNGIKGFFSDGFRFNTNHEKVIPNINNVIYDLNNNKQEIIDIWPKTSKNSCGYNLLQALNENKSYFKNLLIGSEGTLGVFTEIELKIQEIPPYTLMGCASFKSLDDAIDIVPILVDAGVWSLELMDDIIVPLILKASPEQVENKIHPKSKAVLLFEICSKSIDEQNEYKKRLTTILKSLAIYLKWAEQYNDREDLWEVRRASSPILKRYNKNKLPLRIIEDVVVPMKNLKKFVHSLKNILKQENCEAAVFGHIGEANLHVNPMMDTNSNDFVEKLERLITNVYTLSKSLNGTHSGEHGDGRLRSPFLPELYGNVYNIMNKIKDNFDPINILNPGIIAHTTEKDYLNNIFEVYIRK